MGPPGWSGLVLLCPPMSPGEKASGRTLLQGSSARLTKALTYGAEVAGFYRPMVLGPCWFLDLCVLLLTLV